MDVSSFLLNIIALSIHYDLSVTSWIRSRSRNNRVGGAPASRHLIGLAVDIVLDEESEKASFMKEARRMGMIALDEKDHIHVQVE